MLGTVARPTIQEKEALHEERLLTVVCTRMREVNRNRGRQHDPEHEAKVLELVRSRLKEARRCKITGKMLLDIDLGDGEEETLTFETQLMKGGPTATYSEIKAVYRLVGGERTTEIKTVYRMLED